MAGRRLAFNSPSTPLRGHQLSASPQTDEKKLLMISVDRLVNSNNKLPISTSGSLHWSVRDSAGFCPRRRGTDSKKRRRAHDPTIAEAVRRLHNSETNYRRYEPEQGLISSHNEPPVRRIVRRDAGASGSAGTLIAGGNCEGFSAESSEKKEAAGIETKCAG
ncbi:uncharacterized protein LOC144391187 isoform X2 [Gasterosteus aculeatus]